MDLELLNSAVNGNRRAVARVLSLLENRMMTIKDIKSQLPKLFSKPKPDAWSSIAITGAPGVGKSCLIDKILISSSYQN